jgi:hypothetical protein
MLQSPTRKVNMTISLAFLAPDLVKAANRWAAPPQNGSGPPLRPPGRMVSSAPDAWTGRAVTFQSNRVSPETVAACGKPLPTLPARVSVSGNGISRSETEAPKLPP